MFEHNEETGFVDLNDKPIHIGDKVKFRYIAPNGKVTEQLEDHTVEIQFKEGIIGVERNDHSVYFTPLREFCDAKETYFIPGLGNKVEYDNKVYCEIQ